jgi:hypothetical protein
MTYVFLEWVLSMPSNYLRKSALLTAIYRNVFPLKKNTFTINF